MFITIQRAVLLIAAIPMLSLFFEKPSKNWNDLSQKTIILSEDLENKQEDQVNNLPCTAAINEIAGTIFQDFNYNGIYDASETTGLKGIPVTATDSLGNTFTAVTDDFGSYTLIGLSTNTTYRIEFIFPDSLVWARPTFSGMDNGTTVQFKQSGNCANLGIASPDDYCQDNPDIAVPCFIEGAYNAANSGEDALVFFPYDAEGHDFTGSTPTTDYEGDKFVDWLDVGATYGEAWQANHKKLYLGAFHKRFSGFGPNGPDAIYQLDRTGAITGVIELDALLGVTDAAGPDVHDFTQDANGNAFDADAYPVVGKTSFGDIELSSDGESLFAMNLFNNKIYSLDVTTGNTADVTVIDSFPSPTPCAVNTNRPFGLAWYQGKLWVGVVCEDASNAYVYALNIETGIYSLEVTVPLGYDREYIFEGTSPQADGNWNPWSDDINTVNYSTSSSEITYPQPMLTDIEFDHQSGNMILGFRDRWGDQMGQNIPAIPGTNSPNVYADAGGDMLKVCRTASGWLLEGVAGCTTLGANLNSGPGGGNFAEFYNWDFYTETTDWTPTGTGGTFYHKETFMGGLLQVAQERDVVTTIMDPYSDFGAGITRNSNLTGRREGVPPSDTIAGTSLIGGYTIYDTGDFSGGYPTGGITFAKGNGLGDLEALCNPAPIQIGNLVWEDTNEDGIQDPGEPGIENVRVELYDAAGTLLAFDTTDVNGQYYFSANNVDDATWLTVNDTIDYNTDYYIVVGNGQFTNEELALGTNTYELTIDSTNIGANSPSIDSDGEIITSSPGGAFDNLPATLISTGSLGEVDHTFDFGFHPTTYDYGDLPDTGAGTSGVNNYETLSSSNGPNHEIIDGLMLGDTVDAELNGAPSGLADGDDLGDANDDDDGLVFMPSIDPNRGGIIRLPLSITNTTGDTAHVEAWIDWNGDGDFDDPNEMVANLQDNANGVFPSFLNITIPNNALLNTDLGVRIRLSNRDDMTPYGRIDSGEVEDYLIEIGCPTAVCVPIGATIIRIP